MVAEGAHDATVRAATLPEGAKYFPDEGGIMFQGKVWYPADYVLTRNDIAHVVAETRAATLEEAAQIAETYGKNGLGQVPYNQAAIAAAIRVERDRVAE